MTNAERRLYRTRAGSLIFFVIVLAHVLIGTVLVTAGFASGVSIAASVADWVLPGLLAAVLVVRGLRHPVGVIVALTCDLLPLLVIASAIAVAAAVIERQWALAIEGSALTGAGLATVLPRLVAAGVPAWVADAPSVIVTSANVFVGNRTMQRTASQLLDTDADVIVLNEASDQFMACFDAAGGATQMPYRVIDHEASPDYRTVVAARLPLEAGSGVFVAGPLRLVCARVNVGGSPTSFVGLHLRAAVERRGHSRWLAETAMLADMVRLRHPRVVIAGDFNGTLDRPQIRELVRNGFADAHTTLGRGLLPSLKPAATGPLSWLALLRVDHLLAGPGTRPVSIRNLRMHGSDHHALVAKVAIAQPESRSSNASS